MLRMRAFGALGASSTRRPHYEHEQPALRQSSYRLAEDSHALLGTPRRRCWGGSTRTASTVSPPMSALVTQPRPGSRPHPKPLRHRTIRVGFGALLVASLACGGDSTGPESIEGTYALQTMNGKSLPVVFLEDETGKYEIMAGSVTLSTPNAFTMKFTFRQTLSAQVNTITSEVGGTWTRSGANLTLTTPDGDSVVGSVSGRTLKVMDEAEDLGTIEWVFRK